MRRAYVDILEGQMHYRYCGAGEPIILLHMSGSSSDEYEQVGNLLSKKFTVYALDLLGHGASDRPSHLYSIQEHAQSVISFMDALEIRKAIIFGTLVGANIAARLAVKWPERVSKLMLAQVVYNPRYEDFTARKNLYPAIKLSADGSHMQDYWKRVDKFGASPEVNSWRAISQCVAGPFSESLHWAAFDDEDYANIFPKIIVPTVVIAFGAYFESYIMQLVAEMIPNARIVTIDGETGYVSKTNPHKVATCILNNI